MLPNALGIGNGDCLQPTCRRYWPDVGFWFLIVVEALRIPPLGKIKNRQKPNRVVFDVVSNRDNCH